MTWDRDPSKQRVRVSALCEQRQATATTVTTTTTAASADNVAHQTQVALYERKKKGGFNTHRFVGWVVDAHHGRAEIALTRVVVTMAGSNHKVCVIFALEPLRKPVLWRRGRLDRRARFLEAALTTALEHVRADTLSARRALHTLPQLLTRACARCGNVAGCAHTKMPCVGEVRWL
jgi:hypothetical protein